MATNLKRVDECVAGMAMRDEQMRPLISSFEKRGDQVFVSAYRMAEFLGYKDRSNFMACVDRARIMASKSGRLISENFLDAGIFDAEPGDVWLSVWAAFASVLEADVRKENVAIAKSYFASQAEESVLEDEVRLRERQAFKQNHKDLHASASKCGVTSGQDHQLFDHHGYKGMYQRGIRDVEAMKQVPKGKSLTDCAGATELAANNLRMALTKDALDAGRVGDKKAANSLHERNGKFVRKAVIDASGIPPELLPLADKTIDEISREKKKELTNAAAS